MFTAVDPCRYVPAPQTHTHTTPPTHTNKTTTMPLTNKDSFRAVIFRSAGKTPQVKSTKQFWLQYYKKIERDYFWPREYVRLTHWGGWRDGSEVKSFSSRGPEFNS